MSLKTDYLKILKNNQRDSGGRFFTLPSSSYYPHQWFWDSCFHSIIYASFGQFQKAEDELKSLLAKQWENGMIPHLIYLDDTRFDEDWGTNNMTSSITQPPMIAYAAEKICKRNKKFVKDIFEQLNKYYDWLYDARSENYLLSIIHPWESGLDDFVSWDSVLSLENPDKKTLADKKRYLLAEYVKTGHDSRKFMKRNLFNVKCLVFNSIYILNLRSMVALAKVLGKNSEQKYQDRLDKTNIAYKRFFDKKTKVYTTFDSNGFVKNNNNFSVFFPLVAGALTKEEAKGLVTKMKTHDFWTKYPIPTVAKTDKSFEADRYWRGTVWININWFLCKALRRYGFFEVADEIKKKSLELVKTGFYEYFNPITGKGYGPDDFSWSGLVFDM